MILVLGKARSCRVPNLCSRGLSHLGDLTFCQKTSAWEVMHEWAHCRDEAANHQWPIAVAFWIIRIVSTEECSSLTQNLMQICCSTCSVVLNATATQDTCSLNGVYYPPLTSTVKSSLFMHVHSSPLCLAARLHDAVQTVLIILTMVGLFPDRPQMFTEGGVGARKNSNRWNY